MPTEEELSIYLYEYTNNMGITRASAGLLSWTKLKASIPEKEGLTSFYYIIATDSDVRSYQTIGFTYYPAIKYFTIEREIKIVVGYRHGITLYEAEEAVLEYIKEHNLDISSRYSITS